jgi:predicted nucleic acid-binding protein
MIVVRDASPIIDLAVIGQLPLLQKLYDHVVVPQSVYDQIMLDDRAKEVAVTNWIEPRQITNKQLVKFLAEKLKVREAEAVALIIELEADLLLIDDRKGRKTERRLGINHVGLLGVLIKARKDGVISHVGPLMDELMDKADYSIRQGLYDHVLEMTGENE